MTEQVLNGLVASEGITIGPLVHWSSTLVLNRSAGSVSEERAVFLANVTGARHEVSTLMEGLDEMASEIMEFQLAMLEDEDFLKPVEDAIDQGLAADVAWRQICEAEITDYAQSDSEYLAARVDDLRDIRDRVLRIFSGKAASDGKDLPYGGIVFAQDMTPSTFLAFDWARLAGAALRGGSPTSHVSILARARGVPLLVGVEGPQLGDSNGVSSVLDAVRGRLIVAPLAKTVTQIVTAKSALDTLNAKADFMRGGQAITADDVSVKVMINVDSPEALADIPVANCDGIGLFRTEFLIEGPTLPSEESQLEIYSKVMDWAEGKPVTVRTFDAGGDKPVAGLSIVDEANPFLGMRGVRLTLANPEVFKTQLRALVRANVDGNLRIMVPMVSIPSEIDEVKALLDEVCAGLGKCNRPKLGMMVEVPAAALTAAQFDVDFFSIGSNDLVQYTMAAARDNPAVSYLAQADNPAVMFLIAQTIRAADEKGVEVSLCGDMASNENHTEGLLQIGLRSFSVSDALLGRVKLAMSEATTSGGSDG